MMMMMRWWKYWLLWKKSSISGQQMIDSENAWIANLAQQMNEQTWGVSFGANPKELLVLEHWHSGILHKAALQGSADGSVSSPSATTAATAKSVKHSNDDLIFIGSRSD